MGLGVRKPHLWCIKNIFMLVQDHFSEGMITEIKLFCRSQFLFPVANRRYIEVNYLMILFKIKSPGMKPGQNST